MKENPTIRCIKCNRKLTARQYFVESYGPLCRKHMFLLREERGISKQEPVQVKSIRR